MPDEPLWREVLGRRLRALRRDQDETLAETAARAGISPQYLSEVERGRKEPSSEMIAAVAGALGTTLIDLTEQVAGDLRRWRTLTVVPDRTDATQRADVAKRAGIAQRAGLAQRAIVPQRASAPQRVIAPQARLSLAA